MSADGRTVLYNNLVVQFYPEYEHALQVRNSLHSKDIAGELRKRFANTSAVHVVGLTLLSLSVNARQLKLAMENANV